LTIINILDGRRLICLPVSAFPGVGQGRS